MHTNKTCLEGREILSSGAKRRIRRGRVFLDFFVVQKVRKIQSPKIFWKEDFCRVGRAYLCALDPPSRSRARRQAPLNYELLSLGLF